MGYDAPEPRVTVETVERLRLTFLQFDAPTLRP